jgi:hypothetical protein
MFQGMANNPIIEVYFKDYLDIYSWWGLKLF